MTPGGIGGKREKRGETEEERRNRREKQKVEGKKGHWRDIFEERVLV